MYLLVLLYRLATAKRDQSFESCRHDLLMILGTSRAPVSLVAAAVHPTGAARTPPGWWLT